MRKAFVSVACVALATLCASVGLAQPRVADPKPMGTAPPTATKLTLPPPALTAVTPDRAYWGDTVTVTGSVSDLLNGTKAQAVVVIGSQTVSAPLTSIGGGKYTFVVPNPYAGQTPATTMGLANTVQKLHLEGLGGKSPELNFVIDTTVFGGVAGNTAATPVVNAGDKLTIVGAFDPVNDLVSFKYGANQFTQPVHFDPAAPAHLTPGTLGTQQGTLTVPNIYAGAAPVTMGVLMTSPVLVWASHGSHGGNALTIRIMPAGSASSASTSTSTSAPASACAAAKPGWTYRGTPECQTDTYTSNASRGTPTPDAQCNYVCCSYVSGMNGPACGGANRHQYPADCAQYGTNAQLMTGGCYSPQ